MKPGQRVGVLHAPDGFADLLGTHETDLTWAETSGDLRADAAGNDRFDLVLWFGTTRDGLHAVIEDVRPLLVSSGGLWVAWPKRASGLPTEITDNVVREIALPTGLVDNKVCAIDAVWTGLRLVIRRELRS